MAPSSGPTFAARSRVWALDTETCCLTAQEIFDQAGMETRVMATTTAELGRPAPRPAFSVLASEHADALVLPDWRQGLAEYLEERRRHSNPGAPAVDRGHRVG